MFKKQVQSKYKIKSSSQFLNWSEDYSGEDLSDAVEHINLMRNRRMEKGIYDAEFLKIEKMNPQKLLPASAFKGKAVGWLKAFEKEDWPKIFDKYLNRELDYLFEGEDIDSPIMIDDEIGDGYGRIHLAYALGEEIPVAVFKGINDDE